jgi:hypothetical protein
MKYPFQRGAQNTAIGSGMSQEINREPSQYPPSWSLGRAKVRNAQIVSLWRTRFQRNFKAKRTTYHYENTINN